MATHHIARQRLVLEATGVTLSRAGEWHDRLDRFHHTRLLPALEREFDRREEAGTDTLIDRLEITVDLEGSPRQIEAAIAGALDRYLAAWSGGTDRRQPFSEELLYFLRTGNLPVGYPDFSVFRRQAPHWEPTAEIRELLFSFAAQHLPLFLRRGTQVQEEFPERCWRWLLSNDAAPATDHHRSAAVSRDPASWRRALENAGFGGPGRSRPTVPGRTGILRPTGYPAPEKPGLNECYYPPNAGLVLLHAYLPYLLDQVGCAVGLRGDRHLRRAATLLHYLASGEPVAGEWQLPLTKLLLGLQPGDYLSPATELTDTDRQAADELLRDVITHWAALKNTGIEALREAFLQRPGKLEATAGGWQLTLEQRPQDVLLDRLPWSIGLVKTPWMKSLLQVNWA